MFERIILIALVCSFGSVYCDTCSNLCECQEFGVDCSHRGLLEIPKNIPSQTRSLNLSNNIIGKIENGSFNGLLMLMELKLNKNNLTVLHKNTFINIANLTLLEINRNSLKEIVGLTFAGLDHLTTLKLRQNNIGSLTDGAFFGLSKLLNLHLDYNKIAEVSHKWLFGLKSLNHLILSHNMIKRVIGGWEACSNLKDLDLSHNQLSEIEADTFNKLTMLQSLKLNSNSIASIAKGAFNHTPALKTLDLHNNKLSWTFEDVGIFECLSKLLKLNLAGNGLTAIPTKAFTGLNNLVELNLRGNNILAIQENPFPSHLRILEMNTTSLVCDCSLEWFPVWLKSHHKFYPHAVCGYPKALKGKNITDVSLSDFICSLDDSPKPVIVEEPTSQVALAGADISLPCIGKSSSETPLVFKWKRNNEEIEERMTAAGGEQRSDLKLTNVTLSDSAKYQCIISNAFGTAYSRKVNLSILVFPEFVKRPSNVTAKAGGLARLECAATGQPPPQIAWQKDGGKEFPAAREHRMHVTPTDDDVFFLLNIKSKDSGIYTCSATNDAGKIVANASLTVLACSSDFSSKNITGVILITVVCCAVLTSAVWVIIIYHTRRRLRHLILRQSTSDN